LSRKRLVWRLLLPYLGVIAVVLAGIAFFAAWDITQFYQREKSKDLESIARVVSGALTPFLEEESLVQQGPELQVWCDELARRSLTRVTVVNRQGLVLCDSEEDATRMDDHSTRPEIRSAWERGSGTAIRFSYTLEKTMMYVAVPAEIDDQLFAIRIAVPTSRVTEALLSTKVRFGFGVLLAGMLIVITTAYLSSRITSSIKDIRRGAERFARGDFSRKLDAPVTEEFAELARDMNRMAGQLDDRIQTVINQRNELEAVLASMVEGVLAFDTHERLISLNVAAARLLNLDQERVRNKAIQEAIRNSELQEFVSRTLDSNSPIEGEIVFYNEGERYLQAHGTPLMDVAGEKIGALVVLNDVTKIRRLENIRREFVANASHEIRTPVTSIKGFVETLQDGAMEDSETAQRFLGIIGRHVDRLNAIVEDLLSLSKIEMEAERGEIYLEKGSVLEVIEESVEACHALAQEKDVSLQVDCPGDIHWRFNASLLVQALINLIDNAVKYSEKGGTVTISSGIDNNFLLISVQDSGAGIEKMHIPRLFERFYTVDKARSRKLGGTGLGLAIVKHIVQVHKGDVRVTSRPGEGSTFTISLPE
jgi:two-component system phosphate regulon sensor histidine kinase PhoR